MRKLLVALFLMLIIGIGVVGFNYEHEPNEIVDDNNHSTTIIS
ncbi:hypothetical protein ACDX78_16840 [Virgibacillus oceani]